MFPNGDLEEDEGNVGLFIAMKSAERQDFTVSFKLGIMSNNGKIYNLVKRKEPGSSFKMGKGKGFPNFISHKSLSTSLKVKLNIVLKVNDLITSELSLKLLFMFILCSFH